MALDLSSYFPDYTTDPYNLPTGDSTSTTTPDWATGSPLYSNYYDLGGSGWAAGDPYYNDYWMDSIYPGLYGGSTSSSTPLLAGAGTPVQGGPMSYTLKGKEDDYHPWTDVNSDMVWSGTEDYYDPTSSIWNGWMNQQALNQKPTTPTSFGINEVPTTQADQDYQNALTMADYTGQPLSAEENDAYFQAAK